jgi:uncharacterized protein (DUF58 family)
MNLRVFRIPRSTPLGRRAGLIGLGLLVAGLNTGNNLFYLFFTLLAAGELVGFLAAGMALRRATIEVATPARGTAGAPMRATLRLVNGSRWLPLPSLTFRLRPGGSEEVEVATPVVLPGRSGSSVFRLTPRERGRLRFEAVDLRTDYPFGLSQRRAALPAWEARTLVLPCAVAGGMDRSRQPAEEASSSRHLAGFGEEVIEAREYRPGDDARRIDWKATARTERLILRDRRGEAPASIEVLLDRSGAPGAAFELRVSQAAGAVSTAIARGLRVAFRSDECEFPPRGGALQRRRILDYLALVCAASERRKAA